MWPGVMGTDEGLEDSEPLRAPNAHVHVCSGHLLPALCPHPNQALLGGVGHKCSVHRAPPGHVGLRQRPDRSPQLLSHWSRNTMATRDKLFTLQQTSFKVSEGFNRNVLCKMTAVQGLADRTPPEAGWHAGGCSLTFCPAWGCLLHSRATCVRGPGGRLAGAPVPSG